MELKKIAPKSLLYDGKEENFYKTYSILLDTGDTLKFSPETIEDFEDFEKKDTRNLTNVILENVSTIKRFSPTPDFVYYKNQEGVIPHIMETDKYIAVISLGESQPTRYKIYIESIFSKH